jgi:hypothetical protein
MFILIFGLVSLIACGDVEFSTKVVFTLLYLASFGLLLIPDYDSPFIVAQCLLGVVMDWATFGSDWLRRNRF